MFKKIFMEFFLISIVVISGIHSGSKECSAQFLGNPVTLDKKTWSVSADYSFQKYTFDEYEYSSIRSVIKADFALNENFSAALITGIANLRIMYPMERDLDDLKARFAAAYGISVKGTLPLPYISSTRLFAEAGAYRFGSDGTTYATSDPDEEEVFLDITWDEFWGTAGVIFRTKTAFDTYIGIQGRAVKQYEKVTRNEYRSGARLSVVGGVEFRLPKKFVISAQGRVLNGYAFSIGVSQAGLLTKN
ncbi:MAG: hypothetical protein GY863_00595 [bacterium]|nr:hypothetical protein [bacterium]